MITVTLTPWEIMLAASAGVMRQVENIKNKKPPMHGLEEGSDWQYHIEGCLGEYALAKHKKILWNGKGVIGQTDVGKFEVRTRSKQNFDLILHPSDADESEYWLLCGLNGAYEIKGWIRGRDGKKDEYWSDPAGGRPAFFIPQGKLNAP